jgi:selenide,water dikinase
MTPAAQRVLLVGGGHAHIEVLRRFAQRRDDRVAFTVVSPETTMCYSGMLPGLIAGHYSLRESHVDVQSLALWAGARFLRDRVAALDLRARTATLATGRTETFEMLSLDVGSMPDTSVPGAATLALPARPYDQFLRTWTTWQTEALTGGVRAIAVVGGGAGGVELLLAMHHRLASTMRADAPRFALITDESTLLATHPAAVRARIGHILVQRGVVLHLSSGAVAVEPGTIIVTHGRRIAVDRIVWATSAVAAPWLAASGLACDARGFVEVDDTLRSTSHPFVFAAGDCASHVAGPSPKATAFAIRHGPVLAANLRRHAYAVALRRHRPQRSALALISTGDRHAIASRGGLVVEGDWVWRWKDHVDRAFMAKYKLPLDAKSLPVDGES